MREWFTLCAIWFTYKNTAGAFLHTYQTPIEHLSQKRRVTSESPAQVKPLSMSRTETHFTISLRAHNWKFISHLYDQIFILRNQSGQDFICVTTDFCSMCKIVANLIIVGYLVT